MKIDINRFVITSDFRFEREGIGELARSIESTGLLQLMIVQPLPDGMYDILDGRRRFTALKEFLKLPELVENEHFMVRQGLDDLVVQFTANHQRQDFTPIEAALLVQEIHLRKIAQFGQAMQGSGDGWNMEKTAALLHKDKSTISRFLTIAQSPDDVRECRSIQEALDKIAQIKASRIVKVARKVRVEKATAALKDTGIDAYIKHLKHMEAAVYLSKLKDETVDLIYTDPPFGINVDAIAGAVEYTAYEDSPEKLQETLTLIMPDYYRVLKNNKFIILWTSYDFFSLVKSLMQSAGFFVSPTPLTWIKTNDTGESKNPSKTLGSVTEIAVYGWKGSAAELVIQGRPNAFPCPSLRKNRIHIAQKPESLVRAQLEIFSFPGDIVLDTFSGSGSTLRACYLTKRKFGGCEKEEEHFHNSILYSQKWATGEIS